jgi:hypothetical protein
MAVSPTGLAALKEGLTQNLGKSFEFLCKLLNFNVCIGILTPKIIDQAINSLETELKDCEGLSHVI